jgi:hypothetical protein
MNLVERLLKRDFRSRKFARMKSLDLPSSVAPRDLRRLVPISACPLISVVLPVYNHAELVSQSIDSILMQEVDFELIIVDDGSSDDLESAVYRYQRDKRVRFLRKPNGGISSALNYGFREARAPFLTWTSADNLYLEDALASLAESLVISPTAALVYGNVELIDEYSEKFRCSDYRIPDQTPGEGVLHLTSEGETLFDLDDNFINACFLYRKSYADQAGEYAHQLQGVEDYDYWLRICAFSAPQKAFEARPFYQYRLHENSLTSTLNSERLSILTREVRLGVKQLRDELLQSPLTPELESAIRRSSLFPAPVLKRAREGDYHAVEENPGQLNVGIILDPNTLDISSLRSTNEQNICLFFLTEERSERWQQFCSERGFKAFIDFPEVTAPFTNEEYRNRSLMFFLSRMDFLLLPDWNPESLRFNAGIAAAAGLELRAVRKEVPSGADRDFLFTFLPAAHVTFYETVHEALMQEVRAGLSRRYFDAWLSSQSFMGMLSLVKTGMLKTELIRRNNQFIV